MLRQVSSVFFIILFMVSITLPSTILWIDDSIDVSFFYDFSEEEEEKGSEKNKEFEIVFLTSQMLSYENIDFKSEEKLCYFLKNYSKPLLNLISPPPEDQS